LYYEKTEMPHLEKTIATYNYENFIIFEHYRRRISDDECFGDLHVALNVISEMLYRASQVDTLASLILTNRLEKVQRMLDLVSDPQSVCLTKFYGKTNKKYNIASEFGELFVKLHEFISIYPEKNDDKKSLIGTKQKEGLHDQQKALIAAY